MRPRRFKEGEVHHIYQRTVNRALVFYSTEDYLVFFTIFCTVAETMGVSVLALCPMPDHLHNICRAGTKEEMSSFVQRYTHTFALEWNQSRDKKGSLFMKRFGSCAKVGNKNVRSCLNYNYNNPVERKITHKAEQYRWNFLKYMQSGTPYSKQLDEGHASSALRTALKQVRETHAEGKWIRYAQWDFWTRKLSVEETEQLTDYIIKTWNVIDFPEAVSYYGDADAMIRSFHDNTGSEYDIKEDHDNYSDSVYADCSRILLGLGEVKSFREIPGLPDFKKMRLYKLLLSRTSARPKQIKKYLHWSGNA